MTFRKIILASKSPRRRQLLEWAGVPFEIVTANTSENYPGGLTPSEVAIHIARNKANEAQQLLITNPVSEMNLPPILAADTIVVLNHEIIGKPGNQEHAISTLQQLSGISHEVITGVCIKHREKEIIFSESTIVEFHRLTTDQINYYVQKFEPYDKAGAYAIQEWIGLIGIKSIHGDYYNVMGLPVSRVLMEVNLLGD